MCDIFNAKCKRDTLLHTELALSIHWWRVDIVFNGYLFLSGTVFFTMCNSDRKVNNQLVFKRPFGLLMQLYMQVASVSCISHLNPDTLKHLCANSSSTPSLCLFFVP